MINTYNPHTFLFQIFSTKSIYSTPFKINIKWLMFVYLLWKMLIGSVGAGGTDGKEFASKAGDSGLIPGSERCPEERNDYPL